MPRGRAGVTFAAKLTFEKVTKNYDDHRVLKDIDLEIQPGEVMCLLGPSGCGKTTLLRIASGIERPTHGRVLINDQEVSGPSRFVPPENRGVGLMFQDYALFPHLSVLNNVAFGLRALPREEARREALAILARVGLESYANHFPHMLSGGQQQRVALARAIVPRPAVMLMDEPFSGLDVELRSSLQEETITLLRETRATCMIVTHHPEEALHLGDRIAIMSEGRIIQVGRPEQLYRSPANLFIARLFSEISEIHARVAGGRLDTPLGSFAAPGLSEGSEAVIGIRQRSARLVSAGEGVSGRVLRVRFLGDAAVLDVGIEGLVAPLKVRLLESAAPEPGAAVTIHIDPQRALIFPHDPARA